MLVVHLPCHPALHRCGYVLDVKKPASSSPAAPCLVECSAPCLAKISYWRILGVDQLTKVETPCEALQSSLSCILVVVLHVNVALHVFDRVVHDDHFFNFTILCKHQDHLFIERLDVLLGPVIHGIIPRLLIPNGKGLWRVRVHVCE